MRVLERRRCRRSGPFAPAARRSRHGQRRAPASSGRCRPTNRQSPCRGPPTIDFTASCGVSNRKSGSGDVVRRLAVAVDQLEQIGGEAEGGNVSRGRQKLLEGGGIVAFKRGAGVSCLQAFEVGALGEDIGYGERYRQCRAGRETAACVAEWSATGRRDGRRRRSSTARPRACGAPSRPRRSRRNGGWCRRAPCRIRVTESSSTTMRVMKLCAVARCFSIAASGMVVRPVSMKSAPWCDGQTSLITCPFDRMWTL